VGGDYSEYGKAVFFVRVGVRIDQVDHPFPIVDCSLVPLASSL